MPPGSFAWTDSRARCNQVPDRSRPPWRRNCALLMRGRGPLGDDAAPGSRERFRSFRETPSTTKRPFCSVIVMQGRQCRRVRCVQRDRLPRAPGAIHWAGELSSSTSFQQCSRCAEQPGTGLRPTRGCRRKRRPRAAAVARIRLRLCGIAASCRCSKANSSRKDRQNSTAPQGRHSGC